MSTLKANGDVADWFGELFRDLAEAYPAIKVRERQVRVYAAALQDLSPAEIRAAMARAITESRFFPSVAELRQYVGPSTDDRAVLAWAGFREAAAAVGAYQTVECEDPCAAIALQQAAGSWPEFCALEEGPALTMVRQTFLTAYRDARRRVPQGTGALRLPGLCDAASDRPAPGWVGRLTADGHVVSERAPGDLPPGQTPGALPSGEEESR